MNRKQTIRLNETQLKRLVAESVKNVLKEDYDSFGNSMSSRIYDHDGEFAKTIFAAMEAIENEMKRYDSYEDDEWDSNSAGNYEDLNRAYNALNNLINSTNIDY